MLSDLDSLSRFRSAAELGHFLTALTRVRTGASRSELWARDGVGQFRSLSEPDTVLRAEELGFTALPASGTAHQGPLAWREKFAFRAFALRFGDAQPAVLLLGFAGDPPSLESLENDLRDELALWALCLDRLLLRERLHSQPPAAMHPDDDAGRRDSGTRLKAFDRKSRVLLGEADPTGTAALIRRLEAAGHEVVIARQASELLSLATSLTDLEAIVANLKLPGRSGPTMIGALRRIVPEVPVLVTADYASEEMVATLRGMGVQRVLRKPIDLTVLLAALDSAAARRAV